MATRKRNNLTPEEIAALLSQVDGIDEELTLDGEYGWEEDVVIECTVPEERVGIGCTVPGTVPLENSSDEDAEPPHPLHNVRHPGRSKRLVCSLEKALDENNYEEFNTPNEEKTISVVISKKTKNSPEKNIVWTTSAPRAVGKRSAADIVHSPDTVRGTGRVAKSPQEAWKVFFSDEILQKVVDNSNAKIHARIAALNLELAEERNNNYFYLQPTNMTELKAFIGLTYMRGMLGLNHLSHEYLFGDKVGPPVFAACMSARRFQFLHANLCFDDALSRPQRWTHDRFAAIREMYETFNDNCSAAINPGQYLALDETLYPCRTRISFKQYNSSKPARYGLLYKSINAVTYPFTFRSAVYAGKPVGDESEYYIKGVVPLVISLVETLSKHVALNGRNITMDRLYSSIELFEWLLSRNITAVGTIMPNRKGIPRQLTSTEGRDDFSYEVMWESTKKKLSLHSYVVNTKSSGKKNVMVLSSVPPLLGTTKDDGKKKPAIMKFYDFTKGGTDVVDQRIGSYTCNTKSDKWTMTAFAYMLDTARVNAQTMCSLNNNEVPRKTSSFEFGFELANSLINPFIRQRDRTHLTASVKRKISDVLEENVDRPRPAAGQPPSGPKHGEIRRRCELCFKALPPSQRSTLYKKVPQTSRTCMNCRVHICSEHFVHLCTECSTFTS